MPRFLPEFPDLCASATSALLAICDTKRSVPVPDVDSLTRQSRLAALRGLDTALATAGKLPGDAGRPLQGRVAEFLLRCAPAAELSCGILFTAVWVSPITEPLQARLDLAQYRSLWLCRGLAGNWLTTICTCRLS